MATAMDNNFSRENGLNETTTWTTTDSSVSKKSDADEVPDYNEAFPQLRSSGQVIPRPNAFFGSTYSQSINGTDAVNNSTANNTLAKADEDKRRKLALHASTITTKIVSRDFSRVSFY